MTTPSPFQVAYTAGQQSAEPFKRRREGNIIDEILSQQVETPEQTQDLMTQIISRVSPENRKEAMQILQNRFQQQQLNQFEQQRQMRRPQGMVTESQEQLDLPEMDVLETQESYTPEDISALYQIDPQRAKLAQKQMEQQRKTQVEERKYATEQTKPLVDEMRTLEKELPNTKFSLELAEQAIEGNGKWQGVRDWLAQTTGLEPFRTAKGAELQSAIKQYFLGDLASIKGGRPNQLIEKQLLDAYPKMGRDAIANRKILLGMQAKEAINEAKLNAYRKLEERYASRNQPLPANAEYIVKKELQPIAEQIQNRTLKAMQRLNNIRDRQYQRLKRQIKKNETVMLDETGKIFAVDKGEVEDYKEQGWIKI